MIKKLLIFIFTIFTAGVLFQPATIMNRSQAAPPAQLDQCSMGFMMLMQGQSAEAWSIFEEGFEELRADPAADQRTLAMCALYLGALRHSAGAWNDALETYTVALDQTEKMGDSQLEWAAMTGIGSIYLAQGRYAEAQQQLETALALTQGPECWAGSNLKRMAEGIT